MYLAAPAPPPRWSRAFVASFTVHAAFFGTLAAIALSQPIAIPEPPPIRVQLLHVAETPAPGPVVAALAPPAAKRAAAPPRPNAVVPKPLVANPPRRVPTPAAAKPARPAPPVEAAPAAVEATAPVSASGPASASGTATAGLATGRSAAGSVDPIDLYMAQIVELIARHKRYPPLAKRRGIEGNLLLRLAIAADGSVQVAVIRSSGEGSALLEEGARAAVAAVAPLPPPPAGELRFDVPVRFSLKE